MIDSSYFVCQPLHQFTAVQWHAILTLRSSVFVVEQHCFYLDPDGDDVISLHIGMYEHDALIGCARIIPPHYKSDEAWIGRFCLHREHRRGGKGAVLFAYCLKQIEQHYGAVNVALSAQCSKQSYYERFGFEAVGEPYDDAGIQHITMKLKP